MRASPATPSRRFACCAVVDHGGPNGWICRTELVCSVPCPIVPHALPPNRSTRDSASASSCAPKNQLRPRIGKGNRPVYRPSGRNGIVSAILRGGPETSSGLGPPGLRDILPTVWTMRHCVWALTPRRVFSVLTCCFQAYDKCQVRNSYFLAPLIRLLAEIKRTTAELVREARPTGPIRAVIRYSS